ncbi:kinase-like domain-containing protein [Thamnocephalis sphaerospora]|uniref:non-specific serine/threonine protein kinase n=1 Tax=Thamnocephalis sphaerospora TaxID=78915 RepID=A0A4P9XQG5_9FUNG|nr:kinase-like domain-containing protein [Thamnocephalis sphaerospora]|eukprot:RKP08275.1 kinase-like domain-containing protein [Thamnocephalis sphaerospora]
MVRYKEKPGFMKCTANKELFGVEVRALQALRGGQPERYNLPVSAKSAFVGMLHAAQVSKGFFCIILNRIEGVRLAQFAKRLTPAERDQLLPGVFAQLIDALDTIALAYMHRLGWVHGDIKSNNVIISRDADDTPKATIIDFDMSQRVGTNLMYSSGGTFGYQAPEDFLGAPVDQYKRDSWMLGATIYSSLAGTPPYGFMRNKKPKGVFKLSSLAMAQKMLRVYHTSVNSYRPVKKAENARLLAVMESLMTPDVDDRPTAINLQGSTATWLAESGSEPADMPQIWTKVMSSAALPPPTPADA